MDPGDTVAYGNRDGAGGGRRDGPRGAISSSWLCVRGVPAGGHVPSFILPAPQQRFLGVLPSGHVTGFAAYPPRFGLQGSGALVILAVSCSPPHYSSQPYSGGDSATTSPSSLTEQPLSNWKHRNTKSGLARGLHRLPRPPPLIPAAVQLFLDALTAATTAVPAAADALSDSRND